MFDCRSNAQELPWLAHFWFIFQIRSTDDSNPVQELERAAWQQERNILQNALKQAESKLAKATAETENKPAMEAFNPKVK